MARPQAPDASPEAPSSDAGTLADPQRIVDTLHEPLLALDTDLTVRQVNPALYRAFSATPDNTIGASLYALGGGHFDAPVLREATGRLLEQSEPFEQDKIFQIFTQLDPHGTGQEGSGMGLALSRKTAERHDGALWVESEPGEGSAFHLTLHLTPNASHDDVA